MHRPSSHLLIAAGLTWLVQTALAAPHSAPSPALPESALANTAWQLVGYRSDDGFTQIPEDAKPALFRFEKPRMSGNTGCNQISGAYNANGEDMRFDIGMAASRRGCSKPLMRQERAILSALPQVVSYRIEGDRLLMLDAAGQELLKFHAASHSPLVGHVWQLKEYDNGSGNLIAPLKGAGIDLTFLDTGVLGGSDGCNRYMSGYLSDETHLHIGPIATTRVACPKTDGRAEQASAYAAALGKVAGFEIDDERGLTLLSTASTPLARYRALEASPSATKSNP